MRHPALKDAGQREELLLDTLLEICEAWAREGWEPGPTENEAIDGAWDVLHNLEIAVPGCECQDCEGRR